jgi:hypothetical protein
MSIFKHSISKEFIKQLQEAAKGGWWKDALADPKLIIALRGSSLTVYWRGQSLFLAREGSSGLTVTTHEKYLVDPALESQVPLNDGAFGVASLVENGFIRHYKGPATLAKMKTAAGLFSGLEKTGCHEIAVRNPSVIDCEIAFPSSMSPGDGGTKNGAPRADLASLERDGNDVRLVFWEAKDYGNRGLRAAGKDVPVCHQIEVYRKYLSDPRNSTAIEKDYKRVAKNLVEIEEKMGWPRPLSPLIKAFAAQTRLTLGADAEPKVGPIIFGFGAGAHHDPRWQKHLQRLKANIPHIIAVGDAKQIRI